MAMKSVNVFNDYLSNRISLQDAFDRSGKWYNDRISELKAIKPEDLLRQSSAFVTQPKQGEVYCFVYDPKHKETLPYYDTFPLVLPLSSDNTSFLGLNFHYISPKNRFFLLDAIKQHGKGIHKLNISYEVIASWSGTKDASSCVKRYLYSQMKTPLRKIRAEDIPTALLIPSERFVKADKKTVWRNS